jgi:hypothetical protein
LNKIFEEETINIIPDPFSLRYINFRLRVKQFPFIRSISVFTFMLSKFSDNGRLDGSITASDHS